MKREPRRFRGVRLDVPYAILVAGLLLNWLFDILGVFR